MRPKGFLKWQVFKADANYLTRGLDYESLFNRFSFETLDCRRKCMALTFLYKLVHTKADCPEMLSQIDFHIPRLCLRHHFLDSHNRATWVLKTL